MARQVMDAVLAGEGSPLAVADARGLQLVNDDGALSAAVDAVIAANPEVANKVREGKVQAAGALIGEVMKQMKGQADAAKARELILTKLGAS
jgi:aspartyl-tRNA(Asn)/glutamyl-tRNA(Gln) amidotransferase subunit B